MFAELAKSGFSEAALKTYAEQKGLLMPNEPLADWPLSRVPKTLGELKTLIADIKSL
jgi:hypothetical protein